MNDAKILHLGGSQIHTGGRSLLEPGPRAAHAVEEHQFPLPAPDSLRLKLSHILATRSSLQLDMAHVLDSGKPKRPYAVIYTDAKSLCVSKRSEQGLLASAIEREIDEGVVVHLKPALNQLPVVTAETCVSCASELLDIATAWIRKLDLLLHLFSYLDRVYLLRHPRRPTIKEYGISKLADGLAALSAKSPGRGDFASHLAAQILVHWRSSRKDPAAVALARGILEALVVIKLADPSSLEWGLARAIPAQYNALTTETGPTSPNYARSFLECLADEALLLHTVGLDQDWVRTVVDGIRWTCLLSNLTLYLQASFLELLENDGWPIMKAIDGFCQTAALDHGSDPQKVLLVLWGKYIRDRVNGLLSSQLLTPGANLVPNILALWRELSEMCSAIFLAETFAFEIRVAMAAAFESRENAVQIIVQLARFCDNFLKLYKRTGANFAAFEEDALAVFRFITNKSDFMALYEKDLSRRMLMSRLFALDAEKQFSKTLISFTGSDDDRTKSTAMFRDFELSKSLYGKLTLAPSKNLDFGALVLEKKFWPEPPVQGSELAVPKVFSSALASFGALYAESESKHKYHKLDWTNYALHQVTLLVDFTSGPKDLIVNLLQAAVLVAFEDVNEATFEHLQHETKLDAKLLRRILSSLCTEKYPVLRQEGSLYTFNQSFTDKSSKIRLPMIRDKETQAFDEAIPLKRARGSEIRATIVRIMKAEKTIPYTSLLGRAMEMLESNGRVLVHELKAETEYLINSEYIQRADDGSTLTYVP